MEDILLLNSIERYLEGKMLPDEKAFFEELRKTQPQIDQMVVEHKFFLHQMTEFGDRNDFKDSLENIHEKLSATGEIKNGSQSSGFTAKVVQLWSRSKRVTAIAATIAGITALFITMLAMYFSPNVNQTQLEKLSRDIAQIKQTQQITNNALIKVTEPKIPKGATLTSGGTAFLIDGNGYLVTNAHVLTGAGAIVSDNNGNDYNSRILSVDREHDLAILKIDDKDYKSAGALPYSIKKTQAELGEELFTLGYPRDEIVYNMGYLSAKTGFNGDTSSCQLSLTANPGNSGAPVFNKNGEVIGIISKKQTQLEGVVFALKSNNIFKMVDSLKAIDTSFKKIKLASGSSLKKLDRVSQVKKAESYVFLVKSYN
jgi:S1-C subfamily serine protease